MASRWWNLFIWSILGTWWTVSTNQSWVFAQTVSLSTCWSVEVFAVISLSKVKPQSNSNKYILFRHLAAYYYVVWFVQNILCNMRVRLRLYNPAAAFPPSVTDRDPVATVKKKKKKKSHRLFYIIPRFFFPDGLVKELKCVPLVSCYVWNDETGAISSWLQLLCFLPFGALREVLDLSRGVVRSPLDCWIIIVRLYSEALRRIKGQRFHPSSPKGVVFNSVSLIHFGKLQVDAFFEGTVSLKVKILYLIVDSRVVLKTSWKDAFLWQKKDSTSASCPLKKIHTRSAGRSDCELVKLKRLA